MKPHITSRQIPHIGRVWDIKCGGDMWLAALSPSTGLRNYLAFRAKLGASKTGLRFLLSGVSQ